jgi:hypothetical protein
MKPYMLKVPRTRVEQKADKPLELRTAETLSGLIGQQKAGSVNEERFYLALKKSNNVTNIEYQPSYVAQKNMPGEIRLDFLVYAFGQMWPVQIDGEFTHGNAEQQQEDMKKDAIINNLLMGTGVQLVTRISGEKLTTQDTADQVVRELF